MASITIIGAGIFGLSCGWELARRGAAVRVIEAGRIGAGSSGGTVGALAPHVPDNWNDKKAFQLDSLLMADAFWAGVSAASGLPTGYGRTGRLQPLEGSAMARKLAPRIEASGLRWPETMRMRLTDRPVAALIPASPVGQWLLDGLSARLNPRPALAALAAAIRNHGGQIIEGQRACPDNLDPAMQAGPVIWATGVCGLAMLSRDLGRAAGQGVKGQSALLDFSAPDTPQVFADGLHIVPHADGTTAIGSTSENRYADDLPDAQIHALIARARALCPQLRQARVLEVWAGIRPRAASRAPLLGAWPGRRGHFICNGGFKIGFGMAPAIAGLMADLVLTGRDRIPASFRLT